MPAEISLIILNHNGAAWLERCLDSVRTQTAIDRCEVLVVDNASTDNSREVCSRFQSRLPALRFIANDRDLWYCEGNNVGAREARSPLLLFLNNDLWLEPDCVEKFLEAARSGAEILAARVLDYNNDTFQGYGALGMDWLGCVVSMPDHSTSREIFSAYGCAFVIRKDWFEKIGGFPKELVAWFDEIDLAWRVWIAGGRVVSVPAAKVHHRGAAVVNPAGEAKVVELRTSITKRFLSTRNSVLFWLKNCQHVLLLLLIPHLCLLMCEAVVWLILSRQWQFVRKSYVEAILDVFRMRGQIREWRRQNRRIRKRGDFQMLRFIKLQPGRWVEVKHLFKLGMPKIDHN